MALKLDMSKAYDRVEWNFLEPFMIKLGSDQQWVKVIMKCVTYVSYSILLKGALTIVFTPNHGLRQGDSLSLYLFLLYVKYRLIMIRKAKCEGKIHGIHICCRAPLVTHHFFADDNLLFSQSTTTKTDTFKNIL